jgi:hypothetical protein
MLTQSHFHQHFSRGAGPGRAPVILALRAAGKFFSTPLTEGTVSAFFCCRQIRTLIYE